MPDERCDGREDLVRRMAVAIEKQVDVVTEYLPRILDRLDSLDVRLEEIEGVVREVQEAKEGGGDD